jgi:hypothetical protein
MAVHGKDYLRQSITDPHTVIDNRYRQYTVITPDGMAKVGRIVRQDDQKVVLLTVDDAGAIRPVEIPKVIDGEPIEIRPSQLSAMGKPPLTEAQIEDLVNFLASAMAPVPRE